MLASKDAQFLKGTSGTRCISTKFEEIQTNYQKIFSEIGLQYLVGTEVPIQGVFHTQGDFEHGLSDMDSTDAESTIELTLIVEDLPTLFEGTKMNLLLPGWFHLKR